MAAHLALNVANQALAQYTRGVNLVGWTFEGRRVPALQVPPRGCAGTTAGRTLSSEGASDAPPPASSMTEGLEGRSNQLARALVRMGLMPGDQVGVLCCDAHDDDERVARVAVAMVGATVQVLPLDASPGHMTAVATQANFRYVVACEEGSVAWKRAAFPVVLIADGPNAYWWRALELRESAEPLPPAAGHSGAHRRCVNPGVVAEDRRG